MRDILALLFVALLMGPVAAQTEGAQPDGTFAVESDLA